jgi:hypothetical protein
MACVMTLRRGVVGELKALLRSRKGTAGWPAGDMETKSTHV